MNLSHPHSKLSPIFVTLLVIISWNFAEARLPKADQNFDVAPKAKTTNMIVYSEDGIPVYGTLERKEENICGWAKKNAELKLKKTNKHDMLEVVSHSGLLVTECREKMYVQTGFLYDPRFAGAGNAPRAGKWKSRVPTFSTQCREQNEPGKIIVSFVGDVLMHGALQSQAYANANNGGFRTTWSQLDPVFKGADIAYANLEGPAAEGVNCQGQITGKKKAVLGSECRKNRSSVYTSYPAFNYHPMITDNLKDSGFDIVSTANNHSLDRYSNGVDLTVEALEKSGLDFMGTRDRHNNGGFYTVTRTRSKGGKVFRIAWVACTFSYNGYQDKYNQVMNCYNFSKNGNPIFSSINKQVIDTVRSLANTNDIDGVIVTPHWGPTEYVHSVHDSQSKLAAELVNAGAIAVIGAHPHVLQPWEVVKTPDGREAFIHYSLGNFVSNQSQAPRRASMVLLLGFQKNNAGKLVVDGVRYVPTYLDRWTEGYSRKLIALDRGKRVPGQGTESLNNILSLFPDSLRLDSTAKLTTCK